MKKKLISLLLVLAMMLSLCPFALAAEADEDDPYWYYDANDDLLNDYYDVLYDYDWDHDWYYEMASIYAEMLQYRQWIAQDYGYSNYAENCYSEVYGRDYTPDSIQDFQAAIKDYIAPLYVELCNLADELGYSVKEGVFVKNYTGDVALDEIAPYIAEMSSELLASFEYMREHEMYDLAEYDEKSYYGAYTTYLYTYGTAYVFSGAYDADDGLYTFSTAVHEFGHYNADYYNEGMGFFDNYKYTDVAEVHSQGLELLMTYYYPQLFGEDAENAYLEQMIGFLSTLLYNTLLDEFETYAYTLDLDQFENTDAIVEALGDKYIELNKEYYPNYDPYDELEWSSVGHLFWSPCYVISYATSLAGAFDFWLDAQPEENEEPYDALMDAVDSYLKFCNLPAKYGFLDSFEERGLENPIDAGTVKQLAADLRAVLLTDDEIALNEIECKNETRVTDIMTDYNAARHTEKTFQEILDEDFDGMLAAITDDDAIEALVDVILEARMDPDNAAAVEKRVNYILDLYMMALTVQNIADVASYQNWNNDYDIYEKYADAYDAAYAAVYDLYDIACGVVGKVLDSPCGDFLKEILSPADQRWYIDYGIYMYGEDEEDVDSGSSTTKPTKPGTGTTNPKPTETETETETLPFTDVSENASYYDAVKYVYEEGLMEGTGETKFAPSSTLTRGMVATILYRIEGEPAAAYTGKFTDVADGIWYTDGVEWAAEAGVVTGYTNGAFGPNDPVTREQLAAMLYRYAEYKGYDITAAADLADYTDSANISEYATASVQWALAEDILLDANGAIYPRDNATRAEVAIAVAAFHESYVK